MLPSTLSINVSLPALLLVLLLILLHALPVLLLRPPLRTPTIAGTIATTGSISALPFPLLPGFRKLAGQQELYARDSNLVFLLDSLSRRKFLVDTGASVSVFPQTTATASSRASSVCLLTAGGALLQFGSRRFSWSFQLAPVSVPILGSDFLSHHALLVDVARACAIYADSLDVLSAVSSPSAADPFCAHLQAASREIRKLLSEYPDVLSSDGFSASTPKSGVFHNLPGPPVLAKNHRLDPDKLTSAQAEFLKMEKAGIV